MSKKNNEWLNDYQDFLNSENAQVPKDINSDLMLKMHSLINPSALVVFIKILAIHLVTGFLSLSVCHQFGLNPFNTNYSLADWFMDVGGYSVCMIGCGVTFVSISLFAAGYFLTIEEVKALKRTEFLQNLTLGLISLGLFSAVGAELAVGMAGLWLLGSLIGGFVATQTVSKIKVFVV
ncbi:hypothetical protein K2P97_00415 [bacterium]|nr:hypothetical protein [bacterium]